MYIYKYTYIYKIIHIFILVYIYKQGHIDVVEDIGFKNKRAAHYNEFKLVQAMRNRPMLDEDDDEKEK
jgi:hypothetical protein